MPHISVKMYPGRSEEIKKNLAEKIVDAASEEMGMEKRFFSVSIEEVEKENWQSEVVDKLSKDELYVEADF